MIKKIIMALPLIFLTHASCQAGGKTLQDMMVQDLEAVSYNMEIKYAPKEWKQEYLSWDLTEATENAKTKIYYNNVKTPKDYRKIFIQFLKSTQDYHVGAGFYSTAFSIFPLGLKEQGGRFYINEVDDDLEEFADFLSSFETFQIISEVSNYQKNASKLKVGDEIVAIDGIAISTIIDSIIAEEHGGDLSPTARALATQSLFIRDSASGQDTPNTVFEITVKHQGSNQEITYTFPWFHLQEEIADKSSKNTENTPSTSHVQNLITKYANKNFHVEQAQKLLKNRAMKYLRKKSANMAVGEPKLFDMREKGFLPSLGKILWETDRNNDLYAYLYQNSDGKKIGYLYLDTFNYGADAEQQVNKIAAALTRLNRESSALVLDITDNPGGNLIYTYAVLSLLTNSPLSLPTDRQILIQKDIYNAIQLKEEVEIDASNGTSGTLWGYTYDQNVMTGIINYCETIIDNWNSGKTFTDPLYIYGIEKIQPHPKVRYTKPILLLINELDFSCADFFPAVLQDNNRATLFGKKTAGAGGAVVAYEHNSRFGVMYYSLTNSIATRTNGQVIENLGVTPDIAYELTENDIKQNYVDYIRAVNAAVSKMIK